MIRRVRINFGDLEETRPRVLSEATGKEIAIKNILGKKLVRIGASKSAGNFLIFLEVEHSNA